MNSLKVRCCQALPFLLISKIFTKKSESHLKLTFLYKVSSMVKLKMTILAFSCMVLCGCFVNHLQNYPFRLSETIASFPIDTDSREPQIFELDNIKSDKIFYLYLQNLQGPYSVDICADDSLYTESHNIKWSITMITDGIEPKTKTRDLLFYGGRDV